MTTQEKNSSSRRDTLSRLTALAVSSGFTHHAYSQKFSSGSGSASATSYRIPGEFEPTRALWLSYDTGHKDLTVALVRALLPHVKIKLLVASKDDARAARQLLGEYGISIGDIEFFSNPLTKYFLRDVSSMALGSNGRLGNVSFQWSDYGLPGWCQRRYSGQQDEIKHCSGDSGKTPNETAREIAHLTGAHNIESKLFVEGGAIEVNGKGLIIANQSLLRQRNPGMPIPSLEKALLALPGIRKVIWLPEGLAEDPQGRATIVGNYVAWGTGGHTDEFVRFADASTVLLAWPDEADAALHPVTRLNRARMQRSLDILSRATGPMGERLKVFKVPMPKIIERRVILSATAERAWSHEWTADFFPAGERRREGDTVIQVASASYMNFVIANDLVVVPDYLSHGTPPATQDRVRRILESAFRGKYALSMPSAPTGSAADLTARPSKSPICRLRKLRPSSR
jgi:agmatine deiminase